MTAQEALKLADELRALDRDEMAIQLLEIELRAYQRGIEVMSEKATKIIKGEIG